MSRPDISCHPSVALDVEFEIWDVKPSRNTLLRVGYQCSIAPNTDISRIWKRQSFNTVLLCLDCNKYHRSEPQDRSAGRADWRWNRHEFHWICLAELLTIWVHLKIGRTTISRFDGKHSPRRTFIITLPYRRGIKCIVLNQCCDIWRWCRPSSAWMGNSLPVQAVWN